MYGGARLTGFKPISESSVLDRLPGESRGKVYQCDLKSLGIADYGELKVRGFSQPPSPPTLELYFNGRPQTLARFNCMTVKDSENCLIVACTIKRFAGNGITITGGDWQGMG